MYKLNNNGIWNYDVKNRKLVRSINIEDDTAFNFSLNKDKDKIILESKDSKNETISIGLVNENLEISNLTSIFSTESEVEIKFTEKEIELKDGTICTLRSLDENDSEYNVNYCLVLKRLS